MVKKIFFYESEKLLAVSLLIGNFKADSSKIENGQSRIQYCSSIKELTAPYVQTSVEKNNPKRKFLDWEGVN